MQYFIDNVSNFPILLENKKKMEKTYSDAHARGQIIKWKAIFFHRQGEDAAFWHIIKYHQRFSSRPFDNTWRRLQVHLRHSCLPLWNT